MRVDLDDDANYKGLLEDIPKYQTISKIKDGAEFAAAILSLVDVGLAILESPKNLFLGLTPGQAGALGEDLMFQDLTTKYAGQNVTITRQAYIQLNGETMIADAVVSKDGTILEMAESKFNTSKLTTPQKSFFIDKTKGVFKRKNAAADGLLGVEADQQR